MKRSGIEWCEYTWNPITGCRHNCKYCYAKIITYRFAGNVRLNLIAKKDYSIVPAADGGENLYVLDAQMMNEKGNPLVYPFGFAPTLHKYRMNIPGKLKIGSNIFVGAMSDIFGAWVPDEWIKQILDVCMEYPIHNYLFLTKNPERYVRYGVPDCYENMWYGTTITVESDIERIKFLPEIANKFISIEPLLENLNAANHRLLKKIDWIIIGAETGRRKNMVVPQFDWIKDIVSIADENAIPVFMKDSLIPIIGEECMRKDFPEQLKHSYISQKMREKLFGICAKCKESQKKRDMITLLARTNREEQPKQFGFMCKECFKPFCKELGLEIPEFPELLDMVESVTIGQGDE